MKYQVPQFVEVEDKIFGPLTVKQFVYLAAGGGITLMFISLFPLFIGIALAIPFVLCAVALAFYKVNERPLIVTIEHGFRYLISSKLYIWKQRTPDAAPAEAPAAMQAPIVAPTLTESKLKDLAWSLNIKDKTRTSAAVEPQRPRMSI